MATTTTATATAKKSSIETPPFPDKTHLSELDLSIISSLAAASNPAKIAAKLGMTSKAIQYHLTKLKRLGLIRKLGYGTWEVLEPPGITKKRSLVEPYVGTPRDPPSPRLPRLLTQSTLRSYAQDAVRTHAITTTWQVPPALRNWNNEKRTQYLESYDIPHIQLGIGGGGQRIIVNGKKVWLLNKSIIVYDSSSYFAEDALTGKNYALAKHLSIIKHIERLLHVSFEIGSDYKFKVSRQHQALMHNYLAQKVNEAGERFEVRNGKGLWLLIDNSKDEDGQGMNELETVHPISATTDNMKLQGFLNGLKDMPAVQGAPTYTPATVLEMIAGVVANQEFITQSQVGFAENSVSHVGLIKDLSIGVNANTNTIKILGETVQDLTKLMKQFKENSQ